jgi:hypothetical protein
LRARSWEGFAIAWTLFERVIAESLHGNNEEQFIPDPDKVFDQIREVGDSARYINPLTGEWVDYSRSQEDD